MKNENNDIKELMARHLSGETSPSEESQLMAWINEKPEHKQEYLAFEKVFSIANKHYAAKQNEVLDIDVDQEWKHFISSVQKETPVRSISDNRSINLWYKVAAAVLLLIVAAYGINYFNSKTATLEFATADNTSTLSLPDGSQIILNKNSKVFYSSNFGEHDRKIKLTGEAFFNVSHDASKPFVIDADRATIEVLGTSFNVRAYKNLKEVEVTVQTGVVKLATPSGKTEVKLVAGQKGIFTKDSDQLLSKENDDANFLSWNTGKIIFTETDLRTVVASLNKIYQANIVISTDIPATCEVTVSFDHQSLESVLHVLERTLNLTYQIKGNQIEITAAGC